MMSDATEQVIVVAIDDNAHSEYAITCKFDICLRLRHLKHICHLPMFIHVDLAKYAGMSNNVLY